jgi:hypothetical protein
MAESIDTWRDLLISKKTFAHVATLMPDGTPQVTPVWIDYVNGKVLVNSAKGRVKVRNLKPGSPVAISITDPDNPYRVQTERLRASQRTARTAISTRWRRNISTRIITLGKAGRSSCCSRSN